jgi:hypothetical protein
MRMDGAGHIHRIHIARKQRANTFYRRCFKIPRHFLIGRPIGPIDSDQSGIPGGNKTLWNVRRRAIPPEPITPHLTFVCWFILA